MEENKIKRKFEFVFDMNPLLILMTIIYGITRIIEYFTNTEELWSKFWNGVVDICGKQIYKRSFFYKKFNFKILQ
jgi:hypothetical protein